MEPRQTNNLPWWRRLAHATSKRGWTSEKKSEERRPGGVRPPPQPNPPPPTPRPPISLTPPPPTPRPPISLTPPPPTPRPPISRSLIPPPPVLRPPIPVEILSEIFLLVSQFPGNKQWNWRMLMLVSQHWRAVLLSTPGLHFQLTIRRVTKKDVVQTFIQDVKTQFGVIVDVNDEKDGSDFNAKNFHACFMAAIQAASRWSSLTVMSPPPHGGYKDLQILQPLMLLESIKFSCGSGGFFEQLVIAITKNTTPNLTAMDLADPAAVLCLTRPAFAHIYHSLTTLNIQLFKPMDTPADILPHLQRLETLEACRLRLPIYPPDSSLPLIHTLRFLYLKSVSVQWMAGHVFPALEKCRIIFPQRADTIDAFQPVTMPSCSFLLYHSNDLHPLTQFHLPSLDTLDVKNAQWNVWRGNPQLVSLYPIFAATPQCLTLLRLDVQCSEQLLVYMLTLAPVLEELWLGLAHPNALSKTFCQAFSARELHAVSASEMAGPPSQTIAPLCPSLLLLHLHYRKWTRGPDKKALVVAFGDIVGSRQLQTKSSFSLRLSFDDAPKESHWTIGGPVKKIHNSDDGVLILGISTPHSITPISTLLPKSGHVSLPFRKTESLRLFAGDSIPLVHLTGDHMGLIVHSYDQPALPWSLPGPLPLAYALRVLVMTCDDPSILAGHTLHNLEGCRLLKEDQLKHIPGERVLTETGMPVCTRVDIENPWVLAAFKLPPIHELALDFSGRNCSVIWGKHLAVNANLSGLNLLHLKNWPYHGDLIPILRSVPLLETLIITRAKMVITNVWVEMDFLRAFLPMDANRTSEMKETSGEGKVLGVLCPRLRHLQVENGYRWVGLDLEPIAKAIITLRAQCGSPLKVFTVSQIFSEPRRKFELIGRDGSVTMEEIVLPENAKGFALDIYLVWPWSFHNNGSWNTCI